MFRKIRNMFITFYLKNFKKLNEIEINILRMRKSGIKIGENCRIFSNISSNEPTMISIGNNVTISSDVLFCTHDNGVIKVLNGKTDAVGKITVGNDCFIGMRSIIMLGVTLGDNCIVGAGSVVTKSFPSGTVIAGNPAKAICSTEQYAEKYRNKSYDFRGVSLSERNEYISAHPEFLVER